MALERIEVYMSKLYDQEKVRLGGIPPMTLHVSKEMYKLFRTELWKTSGLPPTDNVDVLYRNAVVKIM